IRQFLRPMVPFTGFETGRGTQAPSIEGLLVVHGSTHDVLEVTTDVERRRIILLRQVRDYAVVLIDVVALVRSEGEASLKPAEPRSHVGQVERPVDVVGHGGRVAQSVDRGGGLVVTRVINTPAGG